MHRKARQKRGLLKLFCRSHQGVTFPVSTFLPRVDGKRANTRGCVRSPCYLPSAPVLRPGATDNEVVIRFFLIPACVASRVHHLVFPKKWLPWQQTKHRG